MSSIAGVTRIVWHHSLPAGQPAPIWRTLPGHLDCLSCVAQAAKRPNRPWRRGSAMSERVWIMLGGALGASLRYGVRRLANIKLRDGIPLCTVTVNVIGCLIFGLV